MGRDRIFRAFTQIEDPEAGVGMRTFSAPDGRRWTARVYDGVANRDGGGGGWEAILFEPSEAGLHQRLAFRPSGWLGAASEAELGKVLGESDSVRSRWGAEPRRAS